MLAVSQYLTTRYHSFLRSSQKSRTQLIYDILKPLIKIRTNNVIKEMSK